VSDWIKSYADLADHPKTHELAHSLNIPIPHALGILHLLWYFAMRFSWRSGDLKKYPAEAIARACQWPADPQEFVQNLEKAGWLTNGKIHDWHDHAGRLIQERLWYDRRKKSNRIPTGTQPDSNRNTVGIQPEPNRNPTAEKSRVDVKKEREEEKERTRLRSAPQGSAPALSGNGKKPDAEPDAEIPDHDRVEILAKLHTLKATLQAKSASSVPDQSKPEPQPEPVTVPPQDQIEGDDLPF
jgi:hypothetical protein